MKRTARLRRLLNYYGLIKDRKALELAEAQTVLSRETSVRNNLIREWDSLNHDMQFEAGAAIDLRIHVLTLGYKRELRERLTAREREVVEARKRWLAAREAAIEAHRTCRTWEIAKDRAEAVERDSKTFSEQRELDEASLQNKVHSLSTGRAVRRTRSPR